MPASRYALREPPPEAEADSLTPDFDQIWRTALEAWLSQCLALFWPETHRKIDWTVAPVFLDKELRSLARVIRYKGKRLDLLAQLALKQGGKALLLLHVEVQAGRIELNFPERMFHYRIRLYERYPDHALLSCAIYLDRARGPDYAEFYAGGLGDDLRFRFPVVNLAAWRSRMAELEALAPENPFAVVVLAQLACRATAPDEGRLASKLNLARAFKKWKHDGATRKVLFLVIDSLLTLPEALETRFYDEVEDSEDQIMLEQLNSLQRVRLRREMEKGEKKGRVEGLVEGRVEGSAAFLQVLLQRKFGPLPAWAHARLEAADANTLQAWGLNVLDADRLEAVFGE